MIHRTALALFATLTVPVTAQDVRKGTIAVSRPWSRATAPRATVGAGFLTIRNTDTRADRLVSVSSPRAARVEIHTMSMNGGVMRMRPLVDGVPIPAGGETTLSPGGHHIMLIGLRTPLKPGERVDATLRFARAGAMAVRFVVGGAGDAMPADAHEGHH